MFADGRRCPACQGVFMPPHGIPEDNPVQCPHCSSIHTLGSFRAFPLDWTAEQGGTVEEDPEIARGEARGVLERWFWKAFRVFCAAAVCGGGLFAWRQCEGRPSPSASTAKTVPADARREDAAAGMRILRAAVAAPDPEDLRPWVLEPNRTIQQIRTLSEREGDFIPEPSPAGEPENVEITGVPGYRVMRAKVRDTKGVTRDIRWEESPEGWRVDWEGYARLRVREWNWLLRQAPGVTLELRLQAERSAVPESLYTNAGAATETDVAYAFSPGDPERKAIAFLRKGSSAARELEDLGWEARRSVTATVSLISPETEPPVVEIRALTLGWR